MAEMIQFDNNQNRRPHSVACHSIEEMLADAIDQVLSPADQAFFDQHLAACPACSDMVADATRGAAWLEILKSPRPEPSALLFERILAQTSGDQTAPIVIGQPHPHQIGLPTPSNLLAFRPRFPKLASWTNTRFQPRLAMTAAMAFFSIALTLNLTGVRLDQLHASTLRPSNVKRTYYEASADAVRYYDNLRVVRVMESRVDTLRNAAADTDRPTTPESRTPEAAPKPLENKPESSKPEQKKPGGVSRRESPADRPRFLNTEIRTTPIKHQEGGLA